MKWARAALAAIAVTVLATTPVAHAQVLPQPPPIPAPPPQLQPLLDLLAPVGGVVAQPGCAALGTVLGLGALAVPGLPGTIEQQTGIPLSGLPIALQPELLSFVNTLLYVQGSGCGLLHSRRSELSPRPTTTSPPKPTRSAPSSTCPACPSRLATSSPRPHRPPARSSTRSACSPPSACPARPTSPPRSTTSAPASCAPGSPTSNRHPSHLMPPSPPRRRRRPASATTSHRSHPDARLQRRPTGHASTNDNPGADRGRARPHDRAPRRGHQGTADVAAMARRHRASSRSSTERSPPPATRRRDRPPPRTLNPELHGRPVDLRGARHRRRHHRLRHQVDLGPLIFKPSKFIGIGPIGWQGVIQRRSPTVRARRRQHARHRRAARPARRAARPGRARRHRRRQARRPTRRDHADHHRPVAPGIWERAPEHVQDMLGPLLRQEATAALAEIITDAKPFLPELVDIDAMAVDLLSGENADRLARLMRTISDPSCAPSSVTAPSSTSSSGSPKPSSTSSSTAGGCSLPSASRRAGQQLDGHPDDLRPLQLLTRPSTAQPRVEEEVRTGEPDEEADDGASMTVRSSWSPTAAHEPGGAVGVLAGEQVDGHGVDVDEFGEERLGLGHEVSSKVAVGSLAKQRADGVLLHVFGARSRRRARPGRIVDRRDHVESVAELVGDGVGELDRVEPLGELVDEMATVSERRRRRPRTWVIGVG